MVFNSVVFLFCFLPLALLAYYLVPGRGKNVEIGRASCRERV